MTSRVLGILAATLLPMTLLESALPVAWAALPPLTYSAKPIRGVVVDAQTGHPLEGVIVVAQWVLHVAPVGYGPRLQVLETVTDAQGVYQFPGWGPKLNPRFPLSSLDMRDPGLTFFKPGYRPHGASNMYMSNDALRSSDWDGKTIKLEDFTGTIEQWVREVDLLQSSLSWGHEMDWRQVPRMTLAILNELKTIPYRLSDRVSGPESLGTTMEEVRRFVEGKK
jgi:hypothetical protein